MKKWRFEQLTQRLGLAPKQNSDGNDGLHPVYDSRRRLTQLHWLYDGQPGSLQLTLVPKRKHGELVLLNGSGGSPDTEVYNGGRVDVYNAWSDNQKPYRMRWSAWVRASVLRLIGVKGCLLCSDGLDKAIGVAHTAGGFSHLCANCWRHLRIAQPLPRRWPLGERRCGGCGECFGDEVGMYEGRGGKLCTGCASEIRPSSQSYAGS